MFAFHPELAHHHVAQELRSSRAQQLQAFKGGHLAVPPVQGHRLLVMENILSGQDEVPSIIHQQSQNTGLALLSIISK